jgi:hypothetical protein
MVLLSARLTTERILKEMDAPRDTRGSIPAEEVARELALPGY